MAIRKHYCIVARYHEKDENGQSKVKFAKLTLSQEAKDAGFLDIWAEYEEMVKQKESKSDVNCKVSPAQIITERSHSGDENGNTSYQLCRIIAEKEVDGYKTEQYNCILEETEQIVKKESKSDWVEISGKIICGREHKGDENANTTTTFAKIYISENGRKYPVELTDIEESEFCKESQSYFYRSETEENTAWMAQLEDSTKLKDMILPASHDAGISEIHHQDILSGTMGTEMILTQDANIFQQLEQGCRYFDIRVDYDHEELVTYHRAEIWNSMILGANGQSLKDVFNQAEAFLKKYKTETAIIKISHIRNDKMHSASDTIEKLMPFLKNYKEIFYCSDIPVKLHELTIKELRGKLLIVCDFGDISVSESGEDGIFRYVDAGNGTAKVKENILKVYDKYSNTKDYNKMEKDQLEKWENNGNNPESKLFLLSWTLTQTTDSIKQGAIEANSHLEAVLHEKIEKQGWNAPRLVYMDFISAKMCSVVIHYNTFQK